MKYWNHKGKHQRLYDRLSDQLVPTEGRADTDAGEMLRVLGNVYYDVYNNGGCNLGSSRNADVNALTNFLADLRFPKSRMIRCRLAMFDDDVDFEELRRYVDDKPFQEALDEAVDCIVIAASKLAKTPKSKNFKDLQNPTK